MNTTSLDLLRLADNPKMDESKYVRLKDEEANELREMNREQRRAWLREHKKVNK